MKEPPVSYYRHRFPAGVIRQAIWLHYVFSLSLRDVELLLVEPGMVVSYESIRRWCLKLGAAFANRPRRRRPRPGDRWHLDEVVVGMRGELHYLWRAVDQNGLPLDILVQNRRDAGAAKRFFKRLLKSLQYVPSVLVTDKLANHGVAKRELLPEVEHRQGRYLNKRAENAYKPTRRRERQMQRFKINPTRPTLPLVARVHLRALPSAAPPHDGDELSSFLSPRLYVRNDKTRAQIAA